MKTSFLPEARNEDYIRSSYKICLSRDIKINIIDFHFPDNKWVTLSYLQYLKFQLHATIRAQILAGPLLCLLRSINSNLLSTQRYWNSMHNME